MRNAAVLHAPHAVVAGDGKYDLEMVDIIRHRLDLGKHFTGPGDAGLCQPSPGRIYRRRPLQRAVHGVLRHCACSNARRFRGTMKPLSVTSPAIGLRVMWTYIVTGLTIFLLMLLVGISMRGSQAGWWTIEPGTFYSLLSLHGIGMLTAMVVAGLGTLWYLVSRETGLDARVAYLAYAFFVAGVACVIVS